MGGPQALSRSSAVRRGQQHSEDPRGLRYRKQGANAQSLRQEEATPGRHGDGGQRRWPWADSSRAQSAYADILLLISNRPTRVHALLCRRAALIGLKSFPYLCPPGNICGAAVRLSSCEKQRAETESQHHGLQSALGETQEPGPGAQPPGPAVHGGVPGRVRAHGRQGARGGNQDGVGGGRLGRCLASGSLSSLWTTHHLSPSFLFSALLPPLTSIPHPSPWTAPLALLGSVPCRPPGSRPLTPCSSSPLSPPVLHPGLHRPGRHQQREQR